MATTKQYSAELRSNDGYSIVTLEVSETDGFGTCSVQAMRDCTAITSGDATYEFRADNQKFDCQELRAFITRISDLTLPFTTSTAVEEIALKAIEPQARIIVEVSQPLQPLEGRRGIAQLRFSLDSERASFSISFKVDSSCLSNFGINARYTH